MRFIRSLAQDQNAPGDFSEKDEANRTVQVKMVGGYAVTCRADHAASEIKITHIKSADQWYLPPRFQKLFQFLRRFPAETRHFGNLLQRGCAEALNGAKFF